MSGSIIISGSKEYNENYINAVNKSSGTAVYEYCPKYKKEYAGLILAGGLDMDPMHYNQPNRGSKGIDATRDEAELKILHEFIQMKKPVLGICRGHQTINVYFGGDLIQDLETKYAHQKEGDAVHNTRALKKSILYKLYGEEFVTNSNHHQGIGKLGCGLLATQYTKDGVIEGIEHKELPIYGVQWHPERMCYDKYRSDTIDASKLIKWFVSLCDEYSKT
jgi:putative glutamine amidotransferase